MVASELGPTFAEEQILRFHCCERIRPAGFTLGLHLPMRKSLDFSALGLSGSPRAYLFQRANDWISLLYAYQAYLGHASANEQLIEFHYSGPIGPTLGLPVPTDYSFEAIDFKANSISRGKSPS